MANVKRLGWAVAGIGWAAGVGVAGGLTLAAPMATAAALDAAAAAAAAPPSQRAALPPAAPLLDAPIMDLDDKPVSLRALVGKVVVVLHQDRYSSDQNPQFKDRLGQLVVRHPERIRLVALAEVGGYNFWPARGYVKDALRPLRALGGATVACDWHGTVQKKYHLQARQSAVFVVAPDGTLAVLEKGVLPAATADALLGQIEKLALD